MTRSAFSRNLSARRRERGWTLEKLAQEVDKQRPVDAPNTSRGYLHSLEAGTKKEPSPTFVEWLAKALGCTTADLWDDPEAFEREAAELFRQIDKEQRPFVLSMLRGAVEGDKVKPDAA